MLCIFHPERARLRRSPDRQRTRPDRSAKAARLPPSFERARRRRTECRKGGSVRACSYPGILSGGSIKDGRTAKWGTAAFSTLWRGAASSDGASVQTEGGSNHQTVRFIPKGD